MASSRDSRITSHAPALAIALAGLLVVAALSATGAQTKAPSEPLGESLCPVAIVVEQRATTVPEGWQAAQTAAKPQLVFVTFFDGPPEERVSLKYSSEEKQKRDWVATWSLATNSRGYWIQCGYDNTTTVLSRRLPASVTTCKVTYERKTQVASGLPAVKHVVCK